MMCRSVCAAAWLVVCVSANAHGQVSVEINLQQGSQQEVQTKAQLLRPLKT
jgi:hypothetical protein